MRISDFEPEQRTATLETRVVAMETRVVAMETRVAAMETRVAAMETGVAAMETRAAALGGRDARQDRNPDGFCSFRTDAGHPRRFRYIYIAMLYPSIR